MNTKIKIGALVAALVMGAGMVDAQTLLTDSFSYSDGAVVGASGSPWLNNSGTAGQFNVTSGQLFLDDNDTEDVKAALSSEISSGIITASFTINASSADVPSTTGGAYIAHFIGDSDLIGTPSAFVGRLYAKTPNVAATGAYTLGIANSTSTGSSAVYFTSDLFAGTTYTVSISYNFSTLTTTLTVAGVGSVVATDTVATTVRISDFGFRETTSTGDFFIDNLSVAASVPEPSSIALLAGGMTLAGVMIRRKRRS